MNIKREKYAGPERRDPDRRPLSNAQVIELIREINSGQKICTTMSEKLSKFCQTYASRTHKDD